MKYPNEDDEKSVVLAAAPCGGRATTASADGSPPYLGDRYATVVAPGLTTLCAVLPPGGAGEVPKNTAERCRNEVRKRKTDEGVWVLAFCIVCIPVHPSVS